MKRAVHALGAIALAGAGIGMSVAATAGLAIDGGAPVTPANDGLTLIGVAVAASAAATGLGHTVVREVRRALRADGFRLTRTDAGNAAAVAVAAPVTYAISVPAGVGPVVASALVGLCAYLLSETYGAPAYCGSFVGMATPERSSRRGSRPPSRSWRGSARSTASAGSWGRPRSSAACRWRRWAGSPPGRGASRSRPSQWGSSSLRPRPRSPRTR